MRLLAYSAHSEQVDEARLESVLHRRAGDAATAYALSCGIATAAGPVRVPARPDLGMLGRVCIPVRAQTLLLGYLWLLDPDGSLTPDELAAAVAAAEDAGLVMYSEQLLDELARGRERELVRDLLSTESSVRGRAAADPLAEGLGGRVVVAAVQVLVAAGEADETLRVSLAAMVDRTQRALPRSQVLGLARPDSAVLLFAERALSADGGRTAAERLLGDARELAQGREILVGLGSPVAIEDVHRSQRQALQAVRVASVVPSLRPVTLPDDLGVYALLVDLPPERLTREALHPGLRQLLDLDDGGVLLATLERWLDSGGDARGTADALAVHRSSLYHRLDRIAGLAAVDLARGEDRLALHVGLRVARLAGLLPQ